MTKRVQQRPIWLMLFSVMALLVLSIVLTGCGGDASVEQLTEAVVVEPAVAMEEEAGLGEGVVETAVTPTAEPIIDECLACHIDKELLINTADPVEEVVSENEGEG